MGISFWLLNFFGGYVLERILDKLFEDKSGNIHDAFEKAYNSWKVNHISSIIQKKDYDRLKPRFIASLCQKESFQFEEEEESLFQEWLAQIEKCENVSDELQRETIQKLFSELQEMSLNQIQLNDDLLSKITTLIEQVVFNTNQKEAILEKDLVDIKQLICDYGLRTALTEQTFPEVDGYIERYVTSEKDKNNFARFILHQAPQTLYDKICSAKIGKNKFLLIDKGQSGKTTELKEIAYKLAKSGRYFPILIKSYDNPRLAKKDLPSGDIFNNKPIVILIDAADEFAQEERYCFFNIISDYAKEHPLSTIVISCRNNYDEVNSLKDFQALAFEDLTTDQWKSMIKTLANDKADGLIQHIIDRGLQEYMATPFEVSVITNYYLSTGRLLTSRAEIYKQFIESKLKRDEVKLHPDSKQLKYNSLPYLERIAVVMQSYGNDYILTYPEVQKCIDGKEDKIELIKRSNLIIPLEGDRYKFSENAYREYLAAAYISRLSVDKIFSFIKYRDIDSIRQQWVNVVIILLPILNKEYKDKFDILLKWLVAHDPEIVLFIDRTIVDKDTRENVFHILLSHYHKQKRLIAPVNPQMSKKIMEFVQSAETLQYLFNEVKKNKDNDIIYLENLFSFIEFAQFSDLFLCGEQKLIDDFTDIVFHLISSHVEDSDEKTFIFYLPLHNNYYLENDTYINRLIKTVGNCHNRYAVEAVMTMVCLTGMYDKYADYVLDHEKDLHDYQDKNGVTVCVFRFSVNKALARIQIASANLRKLFVKAFYRCVKI